MIEGVYIIEDFYDKPHEVRSEILKMDFDLTGNYPGRRTKRVVEGLSHYLKLGIQDRVIKQDIIDWNDSPENTAFQLVLENEKTWVHHDDFHWGGVLYLTPNAPVESGTSIYQHKETGVSLWDGVRGSQTDLSPNEDWEEIVFIGNKFNRLVLYNGRYYHSSKLSGFGTDLETGRLTQTFFFNVRTK